MKYKCYIGIDPGLTGAIVAIMDNEIVVTDTTTISTKVGKKNKTLYDVQGMVAALKEFTDSKYDVRVALEKVHSMKGQGVASTFSTGEGFGLWKGIITAMGFSMQLVTPQAWKKVMMDGTTGKDKDADRLRAIELFPEAYDKLQRKKDHGRADALLIAEYLRRTA